MADGPEVSVVVSTRQRASLLPRLVDALEAQTLAPERFEVIVVDDSAEDDTASVLSALAERTALTLRRLRTERQSGPAAGRNLGWRAAAAPLIAFTDDDCIPTPQWLAAGLAAHQGEARCVVGRTLPDPTQKDKARRAFARSITVESVRFFETCNVFYRRQDLEAVGGFDERFRRPSGEDTALGFSVHEQGIEAVYAPDALVYHEIWPGGLRVTLREALRWADLPLVVRQHPSARQFLRFRLFWRDGHPWALLALAGLLLAARRPWALALLAPWLDYRLRRAPVCPGPRRRVVALPGSLLVDLTEVVVMVTGSVRHRTVML